MKAVVLVGGLGTRLRPLTLTVPKQMLPVVEVTMLERVLTHLAEHGVDEAVLSMGHRPEPFLVAFPGDRAAGVRLRYAVEPTPLDTAGAIRFAAHHGGVEETFVVVNGDVLTDVDVTALVDLHRQRGAEATVHVIPVADPQSFGVVLADEAGRVQAFLEKPHDPPSNLINAGTYVLEPSVASRVPAGRAVSLEKEVFPAMARSASLLAWASDVYWLDAGTPATYLRAHRDLIGGIRGTPPAPGATEVAAGVWALGDPVVDGEAARPCLVGDAAFVARGSRVRDSVVGSGSRVEGATVLGSVLLPGAVAHAGATVEGSIVGPGAVVGEGARLTDLCVIGEGVKVEPGARLSGARLPPS